MTKPDVEHVLEGEIVHDEKAKADMLIGSELHHQQRSPLEKRLLFKSDCVILPLSALSFFAQYLDRNCIGNARVMGLQKDLGLTDNQFYNCLTMFFIGYIVSVGPANVTSRKFKPNRAVGGALLFLGTILCGMAPAQNYETILALRILLGFGCAFIPIITIYCSMWYKRDELATRSALYFSAATISGAFGGLIAYGTQYDLSYQDTGRHPWSWLFIIEGAVAILVGILVWVLLPRAPDDLLARNKKHWLFTQEEIALAAQRYASYNTESEKIRYTQIYATFKDVKTYLFGLCQGASVLGVSVVGVFLPTFVNTFGFSPLRTQLFVIIPYACAFVCVILAGYLSDRYNNKGIVLFVGFIMSIIGYIVLLSTLNTVAGIVAVCFITSGCYTSITLLPIWLSINTGGYSKRGTAWAFAELVGLCFSIMGTRIYTDPPKFTKGHATVLSLNILALCSALTVYFWMRYQNKKKDRILAEYAARAEVHPHIATNATLEEVHDGHINFRYIL